MGHMGSVAVQGCVAYRLGKGPPKHRTAVTWDAHPSQFGVCGVFSCRFIENLLVVTGKQRYEKDFKFNPFPAPEISTFVITSFSSQNLCKAYFF